MPKAALEDFEEDIARARALLRHSDTGVDELLKSDVRRAAWMFAVGALDAYFCDAFADLLAKVLNCRREEPSIQIPDNLGNLKVPVTAVIRRDCGDNWRWRMAARQLIEDDNVLSFKKMKELFNRFFPDDHKVLSNGHMKDWIEHRDAKFRHFGISKTAFHRLTGRPKNSAIEVARRKFAERFDSIFDRRHQCIHNCDRPKTAITVSGVQNNSQVMKVIEDVEFLVHRMDEVIKVEFKSYLKKLGFSARIRNKWTGNL